MDELEKAVRDILKDKPDLTTVDIVREIGMPMTAVSFRSVYRIRQKMSADDLNKVRASMKPVVKVADVPKVMICRGDIWN